jgi:hypothetical protein
MYKETEYTKDSLKLIINKMSELNKRASLIKQELPKARSNKEATRIKNRLSKINKEKAEIYTFLNPQQKKIVKRYSRVKDLDINISVDKKEYIAKCQKILGALPSKQEQTKLDRKTGKMIGGIRDFINKRKVITNPQIRAIDDVFDRLFNKEVSSKVILKKKTSLKIVS